MPRISQIAMVGITLGLGIGINTWRYPIVRQMAGQIPVWEFSLRPKEATSRAFLSSCDWVQRAPSNSELSSSEKRKSTEEKFPPISSLSVGEYPLSGGIDPPLGAIQKASELLPHPRGPEGLSHSDRSKWEESAPSKARPEEAPNTEKQVPIQNTSSEKDRKNPNIASEIGTKASQDSSLPSSNLPDPGPKAPPVFTPPLVPLESSGKILDQAPPIETNRLPKKGHLEGSGKLPPQQLATIERNQSPQKVQLEASGNLPKQETYPCLGGSNPPLCTGSACQLPSARARILQVRAYPPNQNHGTCPSHSGRTDLLAESTKNKPEAQNSRPLASSVEPIELLPPVDRSWERQPPGFRFPWPAGTLPLYPSAQTN